MAQFVSVSISIEGKSIKQFSSFSLSQAIFDHHNFRLACPAEVIDGSTGSIFNTSKNMIGSSINIRVDAVNSEGTMQFVGVITRVEAARHSGHTGDIIITGFSPTVLLDNGPHCQTWEKKAIKNIAQDVLQPYPQNLLQPKIAPVNGETLSYTVQYKETAWQFLGRLSATYGEWIFYDGQKLLLGSPQGTTQKLVYGSNLHNFSVALQVRPANFQMMAYDYMNHEVYSGSPENIANKAGLNDFGKLALQKSEQFYSTKPKQWNNQFLTNKKQLDDFVNTRAAMQGSNMVRFSGNSDHPGIALGNTASISGKNVFNSEDESFGDYTIISVNHYCDGQGNYSNDFIAVPSTIKMPPVGKFDEPYCETQSALVTDNHDPKGLGRVRVKFYWMDGAEKSPWLRVTTPHAGDGKGLFAMPEVGEEVIVGFEGDSPAKPYIIGSVYHGKAKSSFANGGNDIKVFQSRSGNKLVLDDKAGSVTIQDSKGNSMVMDGKGNITVKSTESIALNCDKSSLELKKDGTITLKGKIITIDATDEVNLKAGNISVKAGQELDLAGDAKGVNVTGLKMSIQAKTSLEIGGINTKLSGTAQLDMESNALAKIKATLVQIN
jgi:Rhs element Vgr protein